MDAGVQFQPLVGQLDAGTLIDAATRNSTHATSSTQLHMCRGLVIIIRHLIICRVSWCLIEEVDVWSMAGEEYND